jgi:hypothetical protein
MVKAAEDYASSSEAGGTAMANGSSARSSVPNASSLMRL